MDGDRKKKKKKKGAREIMMSETIALKACP